MKVLVCGAGTMGSGITQVLLEAGHEVYIRDIEEKYVLRGIESIKKNLKRAVEKDRIGIREKEDMLGRLSGITGLSMAGEAELVIEAIVENMEDKKNLYKELDALCKPETIFASNTSALSISELAFTTSRPEKFIGMHFFNPAPVMKLVEVIKGAGTSQETYQEVLGFVNQLGKTPVAVEEAPGFVVNRILVPMINEAVTILAENVASAHDIDLAMKLGANHPMGPLALGDLIGLDVCLFIMDNMYEEFGDSKYRACPLLRKMVRAGYLGRKTCKGFYSYQ